MRVLVAWPAGPIRPYTPGVGSLYYQLEERTDSRRRRRNETMPEVIDQPMEGDNSRQDDAQRICARDEGPRTSDSGEHYSMSHSRERTHPLTRTWRDLLHCKLPLRWPLALTRGPGLHLRIRIVRKWPERTVPGITWSLQDPRNYATSVRPTGSPREKLRLPRREVLGGPSRRQSRVSYSLSFVVWFSVWSIVIVRVSRYGV